MFIKRYLSQDSGLTSTSQANPGLTSTSSDLTVTENPQTVNTVNGKTPLTALPQDVQEYINSLRKEAEEANKKSRAEAKLKADAEEQRLKEQGEYKQLAEQHEARVKALEPISERYTALSQLVAAQIESQIKDWPSEVKAFDPGTESSVEARLSWLEKSKPLIEKLQLQARSTSPGNTPGPRPTGSSSDDVRGGFENRLRASGKYGA